MTPHKALLVGGPADLAREIAQKLRRDFGVELVGHWEAGRSRSYVNGVLPHDADSVVILYEIMGHDAHDKAAALARAVGVPCARISRKWSTARQQLINAGFAAVSANPSVPTVGATGNQPKTAEEPAMAIPAGTSGLREMTHEQLSQDVIAALKMLREAMRDHGVAKLWVEFRNGRVDEPLVVSFEVLRPVSGVVEV